MPASDSPPLRPPGSSAASLSASPRTGSFLQRERWVVGPASQGTVAGGAGWHRCRGPPPPSVSGWPRPGGGGGVRVLAPPAATTLALPPGFLAVCPAAMTGGLSRAGGEEALEGGRPGHAGEAPPLQLGHRRVTCSSRGPVSPRRRPPPPPTKRGENGRPWPAPSCRVEGKTGSSVLTGHRGRGGGGGQSGRGGQRVAGTGGGAQLCQVPPGLEQGPVLPASLQRPWAQLHGADQKPREGVARQLWAVRFCSGRGWGG